MNHHIEVVNSNIKYPIIFYNHFFNQNRPVTSHFHKDVEVVYIVSGKLEAYIDGKMKYFIKEKCLSLIVMLFINLYFWKKRIFILIFFQ